jgi:flagellar biosynthesis protein
VDITDNDDMPKKETPEQSRRAAAVALKRYGIDEVSLPKVVAAGYGKLAEQIVEIAFQNGVKVREDKDLAQMLAAIELDSDIPSEALIAVAEILAYVYKVNGTYQSIKPETQTGHPPKEQADDTEQ